MCISRQMICIRLKTRGIFAEETYRYHLGYRLTNKWRVPEFTTAPETCSQQTMHGFYVPKATAACWDGAE